MGLASLASDAVPNVVFTPENALVELLRVSLKKDAVLVMASAQVRFFHWIVIRALSLTIH
jgi:hypothetical protein